MDHFKQANTGVLDQDGRMIREGDKVRSSTGSEAIVKFRRGAFIADWDESMLNKVLYFWSDRTFSVKIVGSIYE